MTSRIQGWSNRQKDTGWGYAFAHYIPGVALYYGITRRTWDNFGSIYGGRILNQIIIVFLLESRFHFPSLGYEDINDENTLGLVIFFDLLFLPLLAKLAISQARKDGKKRLKKIEQDKEANVTIDNLNKMKDELKQLRGELENLKDEKK